MKENKYESIKQIFAERLQKIRKRNGFSQFETAKALGISQPTVSSSVIDTNVDGIDEEQILTLSTCVNHSTSRFIVHAVRFPLE